jgi:phage FluMu protein gp41
VDALELAERLVSRGQRDGLWSRRSAAHGNHSYRSSSCFSLPILCRTHIFAVMQVLEEPITVDQLRRIAKRSFADIVKADVEIVRMRAMR